MKFLLAVVLAGSCALTRAAGNVASTNAPQQQVEITSDSGRFDGKSSQMTYLGNVYVTDNLKAQLHCNKLTISLPPEGGHPTNVVAETDVMIDYVDGKGDTNHVTADRAVYAYGIVTNGTLIVTNETVTFTGGKPKPKIINSQGVILSEPLVYDAIANQFIFSHYESHFNIKSSDTTNSSPFHILK